MKLVQRQREFLSLAILLAMIVILGCGSTKSRVATEQLLVSDAVDEAVGGIDFRPLSGRSVFFDTRYLVNIKGAGFVNSEYVISSLRQQLLAADVRLKEKAEDADYIVEGRIGTLGSDGNDVIYGMPASKGFSGAGDLVPGLPSVPSIPELALARRESQTGAAKIAAFAYDRKTGQPIWQSGMARGSTSAQDVWVFGVGPFQRGSIRDETRFARTRTPFLSRSNFAEMHAFGAVEIEEPYVFMKNEDAKSDSTMPDDSGPTKTPENRMAKLPSVGSPQAEPTRPSATAIPARVPSSGDAQIPNVPGPYSPDDPNTMRR